MEIEKIPDNVNLAELYKLQDEMKSNENYQNYIKYLTRYFQKDDEKKKKYERAQSDDVDYLYLLVNRKDEKKQIYIEPSKYVNLEVYEFEASRELNEILYQISRLVEKSIDNISEEDREFFSQLTNNYSILKKHQDEIKHIQSDYFEQVTALYDKKLAKIVELSMALQERNDRFERIDSYLTIEQKNEITRELGKENPDKNNKLIKSLSEFQIKELAKKFQLGNDKVEKWMLWIISCIQYIIIQKELNGIDRDIRRFMNEHQRNMEYFMYKRPEVKKTNI